MNILNITLNQEILYISVLVIGLLCGLAGIIMSIFGLKKQHNIVEDTRNMGWIFQGTIGVVGIIVLILIIIIYGNH
jgi:hypothetical protein